MPFTFSHPAIVLPLKYLPAKWISMTGLIIGSMIPDFEYFLRMRIQSNYSHTLLGLFLFDLPLGILLAFLFHNIVRNVLFDNLPKVLKLRFSVFKQFNWNKYFIQNWSIVILSLLIGAMSHLFWDSFTHANGYFVDIIPALKNTLNLFGYQIPVLKMLQHGSTIIGGFFIIYTMLKLPKTENEVKQVSLKYWSVLVGITFIIIAVRLVSGFDYRLYGNLIVTGISAMLIALILTPILVDKRLRFI